MKYKVTDKHPYLKTKGCLQETSNGSGFHLFEPSSNIVIIEKIENDDMFVWNEEGWIEEVEQPEFTRGDMFSFEAFCNNGRTDKNLSYNDLLDLWIKEQI